MTFRLHVGDRVQIWYGRNWRGHYLHGTKGIVVKPQGLEEVFPLPDNESVVELDDLNHRHVISNCHLRRIKT